MAKDISLIIRGNARAADEALRELQRTGSNVAHSLERDFDALGTKSSLAFDAKRDSATKAYERIKRSGLSSAADIASAERGLAATLQSIDEEQYGKRLTLAEKFRSRWAEIAAASGIAYGAVRIGQEAVQQAKVFQTALTDLGKVGVKDIGAVRDQIMALPDELGSATELVAGYYQTVSAGVTDPKAAMDLLTTAAKASKAAHVDQETTIQGLTKVMAGFGGEVKSAAAAADLLFGIEKLGQTQFSELVPVIGDLASLSHQVGVSQYEMGAALSQITQTAGGTSQAATQYRAILVNLLKPTKTMEEALNSMGYSSGQAAIEALGLSGTLQGLEQYAADSGVGMGKLFESSEALTALGPLLSSQFSGYNTALEELQNNAGAADQAFAEWQGTLEATEQLFKNTVGKVMIELGEELAPTVNDALKGVAGWIRDNKGDIIQFVEGVGAVVSAVGSVAEFVIDLVQGAANMAAELSLRAEALFSGEFGRAFSLSALGGDDGSYAVGTAYVPRTGYYQLHRGEEVRTRGEVSRERTGSAAPNISIGDVHFNLPNVTDRSRAEDLAREALPKLMDLMKTRYRTT